MSLRMLFGLLTLGVASMMATALRAALPERKIFQFGEFTIEASAGDEANVEALALRLVDFKLPPPPAPPVLKLSLDDLDRRREHLLGRIAAYLGLAKPTGTMISAYDTTLKNWQMMALMPPTALPRRFSLWRRPELLARIEAGEKIPGFSMAAPGELTFNFGFDRELTPEGGGPQHKDVSAQLAGAWGELVWPVKIGAVPGKSPEDEAADALDQLREFYTAWTTAVVVDTLRTNVCTVLHETVEAGVVWHYLTSKDRRWFCDGVANYVAYKVIEGELGAGEAQGYYDLESELKKYAGFAPRIDLAAWPAAEDLEKAQYPAELNAANYAFATKVIADLCARHGDNFLPGLFKEIGKTKREKATIDTVYKACRKLTGENLRAALPKPAAGR